MTAKAAARADEERLRAFAAFDEAARGGLAGGSLSRAVAGEQREIAGCDEVGRGALAGPALVACVRFEVAPLVVETPLGAAPHPTLAALNGIDDSKRLSPRERERLAAPIGRLARVGIGVTSAEEIDRVGIVWALTLATRRAVADLGRPLDLLVLDLGLTLSGVGGPREMSFPKGDQRSLSIAAASIVAKVTRDRMMRELGARFPGYDFERNKGYGTFGHRAALRRLGPSPVHRQSFRVA